MDTKKAYDEQERLFQKGINLLVEQPSNLQEMTKILFRLNYLKGTLSANQELNRTEGREKELGTSCDNLNKYPSADAMICCCCGEEDESHSAYCSYCGRVPHRIGGEYDKMLYM